VIGDSVTVDWTCENATSCTEIANGDGFASGGAVSGTDPATPSSVGDDQQYAMSCTGPGGTTPVYSTTFDVVDPDASAVADPPLIDPGGTSEITFMCSGVIYGTVYQTLPTFQILFEGDADENGDFFYVYTTPSLNQQAQYAVECEVGDGSTVDDFISINFTPDFEEF
jgi:hypothetical protein